jgi:hypothetical protein
MLMLSWLLPKPTKRSAMTSYVAIDAGFAFTKSVHFGALDAQTARSGLALALDLGVALMAPDEAQAHKAFE